MKKIFSLLLAVLMVVGMFPVSAFAETTPSITAEANKTEAAIGDTIEVTFTLANNPGFNAIELTLDFNKDVLKFTGLKINPDTESYEGRFGGGATVINTDIYSDNYGFITNARDKASATDGKLFVAVFEVIGAGDVSVGANVSKFASVDNGGNPVNYTTSVSATDSISVAGIPATSVTLDKTELTLEKGENYILTATVEPTDTTDKLVFTSSDPTVASVDGGNVKALKAGTTTITATAGSVYAECVVTVNAEENIISTSKTGYRDFVDAEMTDVKSIQFNGETLELRNIYKVYLNGHEECYLHNSKSDYSNQFAGYTLDGTHILGDKKWGSDFNQTYLNGQYGSQTKEYLVSYDDLKTAVGEENIDKLGVTEDDILGVLVCKKVSAQFNYVVLFDIEPVAATEVTIDESASLGVGYTATLTANVTPLESTQTVVWSSSNESVATVDETGIVTGVADGTATITATVGSVSDTCEVSVTDKVTSFNAPDNDVLGTRLETITIFGVTITGYKWTGNNRTLTVYITEETADAMIEFKTTDGSTKETVKIENSEGSYTYVLSKYWVTDTWIIEFKAEVPTDSLDLNKTSTEILLNKTETLVATLSEGSTDTVTWTSDDENIATVDANGKVKGIAEGTVTITAKVRDMVKTCEVTVKAVHADSISISGDGIENGKLRLKKGDKVTLSATTDPVEITDAITWSTSDENIVAVYSWRPGYISAKNAGTATITVTAGEGEYAKSATLEVEVYEVKAESVTLDKTEAEILTVEKLTLTATVTPEDHTDGNIQWSSSNENVVTVIMGAQGTATVTPVGAGEATITAKVGDVSATCKVTVKEPKEGTVLWSYDGNPQKGWPQHSSGWYGFQALIMDGANYESLTNEGDVYTVTLPHTTAKDAEITLNAYACGSRPEWLGVNWYEGAEAPESWDGYENKLEYSFNLTDGEATLVIRAYPNTDGWTYQGTKTFNFVVGGECNFDQEVAAKKYLASEATCTESAEYFKSCVCGEAGTETFHHGSVNTENHKAATKWNADDANDTHYHECENGCGAKLDVTPCSGGKATCIAKAKCSVCEQEYGEKLGHDEIPHDAKAPTCTEIGWDAYVTCSRCDYSTYAEKAELGHDWGAASYSWSDNGKECTATRECKNDASHKETETVTATSKVEKEPNCTEKGITQYTATFTENWAETQTNTKADIETNDEHKWDKGKVTTEPTCSKVGVKTYTCEHNAEHTRTEDVAVNPDAHDWIGADGVTNVTTTKAPTCTEKGERKFTCEHNAEHSYTEEIDKLGHDWGAWVVVTKPTTSAKGLQRRDCERADCDAYEEKAISKIYYNDDKDSGIDIYDGLPKDEVESNPNTGAPVFDLTTAGVVVLAATVAVLEIRRRK